MCTFIFRVYAQDVTVGFAKVKGLVKSYFFNMLRRLKENYVCSKRAQVVAKAPGLWILVSDI